MKKAIARFFGWAVALGIAYWVLLKLHTLIIMFVVAFFLSLAMEPPVNVLAKRGWRRGSATGIVIAAVVVFTIGLVAAFGSVAFTQASEVVDNVSEYVHDVVDFLNDDFGLSISTHGTHPRSEESRTGMSRELAKDLANSAPDLLLKIAEALLQIRDHVGVRLLPDGRRASVSADDLLRRLRPDRQEIVLDTWEVAVDKTGAYLYYAGHPWPRPRPCSPGIFLVALGVPSPLALAILVGLISQFVPTIGTYIAMLLPMLVVLVDDPINALWIAVFLTAYNQFENYVLGPRLSSTTLKVHPAVTIGSVFAGGTALRGRGCGARVARRGGRPGAGVHLYRRAGGHREPTHRGAAGSVEEPWSAAVPDPEVLATAQ